MPLDVRTSTNEPSRAVKLYGTEEPESESRVLSAGALTCELDNGAIRYVRLNGVEVLRAIAFLVRDENWGTFTPAITNLVVEEHDGFHVTFAARCADATRAITYSADIRGTPDGTLRLSATARPETNFLTNRTGFIVLHPLHGVAGKPVRVEHVDGTVEESRFPEIINPMQPFYDIRALSHEVIPGVWATCRMEGDTFEMEDHRNWTDASYKTYVRPLALPWPYTLPAGVPFDQSVTLMIRGPIHMRTTAAGTGALTVSVDGESGEAMPKVGLGVPADEAERALAAVDLLKLASPQILVCNFDARQNHGATELERFRRLGEATGAELVLEIIIPGVRPPREELASIAAAVRQSGIAIAAVAVSPSADLKAVLPGSEGPPVPPLEEIYGAARELFPGVALGGGMFSYFTELNRKRPPTGLLDFVTHTTCSAVHAADDRSVMETLEALPYVVHSVRQFIDGKAYRVGPSGIATRDNPYGASTIHNPGDKRLCLADADPRQRGLFGAAWALGYIAAFAHGGVEAVTLFAPTGPLGIIADGRVTPSFHVIAGLARGAGRTRLTATSSNPSVIACVAHDGEGSRTVWLANLTKDEQTVEVAGLGQGAFIRMLDEDGFVPATTDPRGFLDSGQRLEDARTLRLKAYAVACMEMRG